MSTELFDINQLYFNAFGFVAPPVIPNLPSKISEGDPDLPVGKFLSRNNKVRGNFNFTAANGAEYRMPTALKIPGGERFQLPNEPIVSIRGNKEIKTTPVNRGGRRGSVKEIITLNDYNITIKGLLINNKEDDFPEADLQKLRRLVEYSGALEIENFLLRLFNITLATEYDHDFPRDPNISFRVQPYTILLTSDEDFDLEQI